MAGEDLRGPRSRWCRRTDSVGPGLATWPIRGSRDCRSREEHSSVRLRSYLKLRLGLPHVFSVPDLGTDLDGKLDGTNEAPSIRAMGSLGRHLVHRPKEESLGEERVWEHWNLKNEDICFPVVLGGSLESDRVLTRRVVQVRLAGQLGVYLPGEMKSG